MDAILNAWESRTKPDTILPPKLQEYPNLLQEKLDLLKNYYKITDTQTLMEGRLGQIGRNTWVQPSLEPILETRESVTKVVSLNREATTNNGIDCAIETEPIIPALEGNDTME